MITFEFIIIVLFMQVFVIALCRIYLCLSISYHGYIRIDISISMELLR